MAPSSSVQAVRNYFARKNPKQWQIISHFFHRVLEHAPVHLYDALIVGLDAEWWEFDKKKVTELGISIIDPMKTTNRDGIWGVLDKMETFHVRIMENAHMINSRRLPGHPEKFQFGKTMFVTMSEARRLLIDMFVQANSIGFARPVIFVGHAVENDIEMMKEQFNIDLDGLATVAATIDTQILPREVGIVHSDVKIGLGALLDYFKVNEPFLHNAGNDIACTMIAAFLTARMRTRSLSLVDPSWILPTANQAEVDGLKTRGVQRQTMRPPEHGIPVFCTKCDETSHMVGNCPALVHCDKCADKGRPYMAHTHKTEKCTYIERPLVVVPCQYCVASTDPRRYSKADTHTTEDCGIGPLAVARPQ